MKKRLLAVIMAVALMMSMMPMEGVSAAKKPKLNKKKITLEVGKTVKLKVKNNKAKVKWISKNKKVAKVSKKGKVTAKRVGKTTVIAKVQKKKLKCKITVKSSETTTTKAIEKSTTKKQIVTKKPEATTTKKEEATTKNKDEETTVPETEKSKCKITYDIAGGDEYLRDQSIENPNPEYFYPENGLELENVECPGFDFEGWYDGAGNAAEKIKNIPVGTNKSIKVYAHWTVKEYTIKFNSTVAPIEDLKYNVKTGATLKDPSWFGYTFTGWTDDKGKLVKRIPVGTIGDMTLTANWTSKRNQTIPVKELKDPFVYEDDNDGQILFSYEIGRVENVPLYTIEDLGNRAGIDITKTTTVSVSISSEQAQKIANSVSNATSKTASWTLSSDWNETTSFDETHASELGESSSYTKEQAKSSTGTFNISNSKGGSTTTTNEIGVSAKVGVNGGTEQNQTNGISAPLSVVSSIAGTLTAPIKKIFGWNAEVSGSYKHVKTEESNWNTTKSYSNSKTVSQSEEYSKALSKNISDTYGYTNSNSQGGSQSEEESLAVSQTDNREYSTAFSYSTGETTTTTRTISNSNAPEGNYRIVAAGTVHVFAIVGYDIKTSSYYTYTHNVLDKEIKDFVDYSISTSNFDDNENGVLPFEVPYFVNEYVCRKTAHTEGLQIDNTTGKVVGYNGTDEGVVVPEYIAVKKPNGDKEAIKVTGFEKEAFAGNTNIKYVRFEKAVDEIPEGAFEGCTSLISVEIPSLNRIGKDAFKGCTSLDKFEIKEQVNKLGKNAFENVKEIDVKATNSEVASNAILSGAKSIKLTDESEGTAFNDEIVKVPDTTEYFEFNGNNKTYRNVSFYSYAAETHMNEVKIVNENSHDNKVIDQLAVAFISEKVTISKCHFTTPKLVLLFQKNAELSLYGNNEINSSEGANWSILSRSLDVKLANPSVVGRMLSYQNIFVCGSITGEELFSLTGADVYNDNDINIYKQIQREELPYVLEEQVPEGARVMLEKWKYDLTSYTTSKDSTLEGYEKYDTSSEWVPSGDWSEWIDTDNELSSFVDTDARRYQTKIRKKDVTQYNYSRERWAKKSEVQGPPNPNVTYYYYPVDGMSYGTPSYNPDPLVSCGTQERGWSDNPLPKVGTYEQWDLVPSNVIATFDKFQDVDGTEWYQEQTQVVQRDQNQYSYRDYHLEYTYYFKKTERKESDYEMVEEPGYISNIEKYVQYSLYSYK